MTKERGRVAPPEQKAGGGRTTSAKKPKASSDAKLAPSAQPAASRARADKDKDRDRDKDKGKDKDKDKDKKADGAQTDGAARKGAAKGKASREEARSALAADGSAPSSGKPPPHSGPVSKKAPVSSKRRALTDRPPALGERHPEDLDAPRASKSLPPLSASATQANREADPKGWVDALVERWVRRGQMLLQRLAQHGAADHEYRADLKDGRFVWIGPDGNVSAEAAAAVLCSWSRSTSVLAMGWADPVVRYASIDEIDGMPAEHDDVDEEKAWHLAMEAAELSGAEYLYRVPTPHAWYFLALSDLRFDPSLPSFRPGTPVGLVLRELASTREAIESRAEPADVIRERLSSFGSALLHQAEYAYRNTDWVARLERTGRTLAQLAGRLPRQSYASIAAGQATDEWIERDLAVDLVQAIALLEDEWSMFT
jgi:hypothetical protein